MLELKHTGGCRLRNRVQVPRGPFKSTVLRKHSKLVSPVDGPLASHPGCQRALTTTKSPSHKLGMFSSSLQSGPAGSPSTRPKGTRFSSHYRFHAQQLLFSHSSLGVCQMQFVLMCSLWSDPCKLHLHAYVLFFACFI